jgi:hypothetical protein
MLMLLSAYIIALQTRAPCLASSSQGRDSLRIHSTQIMQANASLVFSFEYASSGQTVELPADVHGVVLRECVCPEHVKAQHSEVNSYWTADTSFTEIKVWGHDEQQRDHNVERALEWMQLAKAIHDP